MTRLRLSVAARRDLNDVQAYGLDQFGVAATIAHLESFERVFSLLRDHPLAGQEQPAHGDGIRSFAVRPHRIFYRVSKDGVLIVRILHSAQRVPLQVGQSA